MKHIDEKLAEKHMDTHTHRANMACQGRFAVD